MPHPIDSVNSNNLNIVTSSRFLGQNLPRKNASKLIDGTNPPNEDIQLDPRIYTLSEILKNNHYGQMHLVTLHVMI